MKKLISFFEKNSGIILIIWLFLFALTFRLFHVSEFAAYHQDQVRDLIYIKNNFDKGQIILLGPKASVGNFFLPPFWYYLMSVAYLFSSSPIAPALLVILLSSLTSIFIYLFAKKFFNKEVAFFSSVIYALSHLSIEYSRFAWNPNPIPLFVILAFYFLYEYIFENKKNSFYFSIIAANLALQLHYQGFVIFAFVYISLIMLKKINLKQFSISILINFVLVSAFIVYEMINNFPNTKGIIEFITRQSTSNLRYFGIPFFIKYIFNEFSLFLSRTIIIKEKVTGLILLITLGLSFILKNKNKQLFILKGFLFFSLVMLFFYKNSLIDFYLLFLIPIIIIYFVAGTFEYLSKKIFYMLMVVILIISLVTSPSFYGFDQTLNSIKQVVTLTTKNNNYCHVYRIFKETFIENKIKYLVSLVKNSPTSLNCEKILLNPMCNPKIKTIFYLCEPAKCQSLGIDLTNVQKISQGDYNSGVDIYQFDY